MSLRVIWALDDPGWVWGKSFFLQACESVGWLCSLCFSSCSVEQAGPVDLMELAGCKREAWSL